MVKVASFRVLIFTYSCSCVQKMPDQPGLAAFVMISSCLLRLRMRREAHLTGHIEGTAARATPLNAEISSAGQGTCEGARTLGQKPGR